MGSKPAKNNQGQSSQQSTLQAQYRVSYEQLHKYPSFFNHLIIQNQTFVTNLFQLFPDVHNSFPVYFEMVMYLRRIDAKFVINKFAVQTAGQTSLLDRYFMIVLNITNYQSYCNRILTIDEADELLRSYFKMFVSQPQHGTITKLLKFIKMQDKINVKQFSSSFREYFPRVEKYLKQFYHSKFNRMEKDGRLMKKFISKIINNDGILLALKIPNLSNMQITMLYNTQQFGLGFHSLQKRLIGYTGPWLMLVQHIQKNETGQKEIYVFGSYQNGPIKDVLTYQGDITGMMFTIEPTIRFFTTDKGDGSNHFFFVNSIPEEKSKRRKGFGFGGNADKKNFKLWIDEDIDRSNVFNGNDPCYGYGSLAGPGTSRLNIKRLEVWGLGGQGNIDDQIQYWKQREEQYNFVDIGS